MARLSPAHKLLFEVFTYRWPQQLMVLFFSLATTFFGLLAPFFQKEFIDSLTGAPSDIHRLWPSADFQLTTLTALFLSFFCLFLSLSSNAFTNYFSAKESVVLQRRLAQRIYDHVLKLRADSLNGKSMGEFVSIYATDVPGATIFLEQSLPQGAGIVGRNRSC